MATQQQIDACVAMVGALEQFCSNSSTSGPLSLYHRTMQCAEVVCSEPQMAYVGQTPHDRETAKRTEVLYVANNAMLVLVQKHLPQYLTAATKTEMMNKFAQEALAKEASR